MENIKLARQDITFEKDDDGVRATFVAEALITKEQVEEYRAYWSDQTGEDEDGVAFVLLDIIEDIWRKLDVYESSDDAVDVLADKVKKLL